MGGVKKSVVCKVLFVRQEDVLCYQEVWTDGQLLSKDYFAIRNDKDYLPK